MKNIITEYTEGKSKKTVLSVDDHSPILEDLINIINREPDLLFSVAVGSIGETVEAVKTQKIDMALVDMMLNQANVINVARVYITKDGISEDIVNAIRKVLKGQIYISRRLLKNFPKNELDNLWAGEVRGCCD